MSELIEVGRLKKYIGERIELIKTTKKAIKHPTNDFVAETAGKSTELYWLMEALEHNELGIVPDETESLKRQVAELRTCKENCTGGCEKVDCLHHTEQATKEPQKLPCFGKWEEGMMCGK